MRGPTVSLVLCLLVTLFAGCLGEDALPRGETSGDRGEVASRIKGIQFDRHEETFCTPVDVYVDGGPCFSSQLEVIGFRCITQQEELAGQGNVTLAADAIAENLSALPDAWVACIYQWVDRGEGRTLVPDSEMTYTTEHDGEILRRGCLGMKCGWGPGDNLGNFTLSGPGQRIALDFVLTVETHWAGQRVAKVSHHEHRLTAEIWS